LACAYAWGIVGGDPLMRPRFLRVARMVVATGLGLLAWFLPVPDVVSTVIGLGIYAAALLALGALPTEIREHLPGPLSRLGPTLHDD
jgi:hypothetical protein